jgi:purine nucleosidase
MTAPVLSRVVPLCRVVVDNDFAGDPDGLVGLAHHLLSPTNRVTTVTSAFLNPRFAESGTTAAEGVELATELVGVVGADTRPDVVAGAEETWKPGARSPASEAIVAAALADDDLPLHVVCGGPLTNVAAALEQEPAMTARMTLVWIGGSLDVDAFEYNRDTDPAAAEFVFSRPGLVVHQFPLETYRQCGYSLHELAEDVGTSGRLGAWLWDRYQGPPDWMQLGGVWPLGDSPPVLVTALSTESSRWTTVTGPSPDRPMHPMPSDGATAHVCTVVDFRLVVGDMLAKLRAHERHRTSPDDRSTP